LIRFEANRPGLDLSYAFVSIHTKTLYILVTLKIFYIREGFLGLSESSSFKYSLLEEILALK